MENLTAEKYLRLIEPLTIEVKLEILSKLSESLKRNFIAKKSRKEQLFEELSGAWKDMDDKVIDEIYKARTMSDRNFNLD